MHMCCNRACAWLSAAGRQRASGFVHHAEHVRSQLPVKRARPYADGTVSAQSKLSRRMYAENITRGVCGVGHRSDSVAGAIDAAERTVRFQGHDDHRLSPEEQERRILV